MKYFFHYDPYYEQKKCTGSRVNGLDGGTMTTLNNTKSASLAAKQQTRKKIT